MPAIYHESLSDRVLAEVTGLTGVRPTAHPDPSRCGARIAERRLPRHSTGFGSYGTEPEHQCKRAPARGDIFCSQHRKSINEETRYRRLTDPRFPGYTGRV